VQWANVHGATNAGIEGWKGYHSQQKESGQKLGGERVGEAMRATRKDRVRERKVAIWEIRRRRKVFLESMQGGAGGEPREKPWSIHLSRQLVLGGRLKNLHLNGKTAWNHGGGKTRKGGGGNSVHKPGLVEDGGEVACWRGFSERGTKRVIKQRRQVWDREKWKTKLPRGDAGGAGKRRVLQEKVGYTKGHQRVIPGKAGLVKTNKRVVLEGERVRTILAARVQEPWSRTSRVRDK